MIGVLRSWWWMNLLILTTCVQQLMIKVWFPHGAVELAHDMLVWYWPISYHRSLVLVDGMDKNLRFSFYNMCVCYIISKLVQFDSWSWHMTWFLSVSKGLVTRWPTLVGRHRKFCRQELIARCMLGWVVGSLCHNRH